MCFFFIFNLDDLGKWYKIIHQITFNNSNNTNNCNKIPKDGGEKKNYIVYKNDRQQQHECIGHLTFYSTVQQHEHPQNYNKNNNNKTFSKRFRRK